MTVADKAFNELTYDFVETLIFEPDDNESDYELFADINEEMVTFDVNSSAENAYSYSWRLIHEDSGLELAGNSKDGASRAISASSHIDVSNMPGGDLILIVKVHDEGGTVQSVKTKRLSYLKAVKKIVLESVIMELTEGETGTLKATITPTDATDKAIAWSSSAPEVASVTEDGVVTALKAGTATITASTANGLKAT
ncbi:MAG: Ig-like domain-containing protein, partial [Paramuribaculum sp.]|nr:Ig-like domain-containing protein [Paramuribaculum sp.]